MRKKYMSSIRNSWSYFKICAINFYKFRNYIIGLKILVKLLFFRLSMKINQSKVELWKDLLWSILNLLVESSLEKQLDLV